MKYSKDIVYRVAMLSLDKVERHSTFRGHAYDVLFKALKMIAERKIKDTNSLFSFLEAAEIDKKKFSDIVSDVLHNLDDPKKLVPLAFLLGDGNEKSRGLGILEKSWLKRNISDDKVLKVIPSKWWNLFRDDNWIEKNKVTKD